MSTSFHEYVMAVDRVEKRLRMITGALDAAGIPYAVIGGNAVAAWVARADPSATRATKDVDLLVNHSDLERITRVMGDLGFIREDLRGLVLFLDPDEPSRRAGVHLVWSGQLVRPSYVTTAPTVDESVRDPQGFVVASLPALVRMKLTSNRRIDQVHIEDLLRMHLIDETITSTLHPQLQERLDAIARTMEEQ